MKFKALHPVNVEGLGDIKKGAEFTCDLSRSLSRQIKHGSVAIVAEEPKQEADGGGDGGNGAQAADDLESKSHAELKAMATAKGLEFAGNVSRAKLLEMLTAKAE
jgi:hypothetical protein